MIVLYVMLAGILLARGIGALGFSYLNNWLTAVRAGMAVMFLFTGAAHFGSMRADMIRMVPPGFPNPTLLVTLTGWLEIVGAIGLLIPATARYAGYGLIVLLIAVFPANVYASQTGQTIGGQPATPLIIRAPLQIFWIALLWWSAKFGIRKKGT